MTAFERFEREIPGLLDEIAPPRLPDYLDDMLGSTARIQQRPAWASIERWLPMDVVARPVPVRAPALRPLLVLLLTALLVAGGLALYAGVQRTPLPEPFGPARNGVIVYSNAGRDIVAFDPVTETERPLISGELRDVGPGFSRDGRQLAFIRLTGASGALWVSNADGSGARELVKSPVDWADWSESGDRMIVTRRTGGLYGPTEALVVDVASGEARVLDVGLEILDPYWRPGHDQLVFSTDLGAGKRAYYLVNADGTGLHKIDGVSPDAFGVPQLSPDGSTITYAVGNPLIQGLGGRIHLLDIDAGTDRTVLFEGSEETEERNPRFSPDGKSLVFERYTPYVSYSGYRLVVAPVDGNGRAWPIDAAHPRAGEGANPGFDFSPDGTHVLATYPGDGSTWLLKADGTSQRQMDWSAYGGHSWQRLAP